MKVNITGKGLIPGINQLAPVYNQELEKPLIRRILNYSNLRVYGANGIGLITKRNIDAVFDADIRPTPVLEKPTEIPATKTEEHETEAPEVIAQETRQYQGDTDIPGNSTPEEDEPIVEETADETPSEEVTDVITDTDVVAEEATSAEVPAADTQPHYNGNKKNKKKNHYNNNKG